MTNNFFGWGKSSQISAKKIKPTKQPTKPNQQPSQQTNNSQQQDLNFDPNKIYPTTNRNHVLKANLTQLFFHFSEVKALKMQTMVPRFSLFLGNFVARIWEMLYTPENQHICFLKEKQTCYIYVHFVFQSHNFSGDILVFGGCDWKLGRYPIKLKITRNEKQP